MRLPFNGSYPTTQGFGEHPAAYAKFGLNGHNGIDYGLPTGTVVVAAISGTVVVGTDPSGFGNYVKVVTPSLETIYAHLQRATAANGQRVTEGQQIGISNNTGNSTGPHLHFGVRPLPSQNNGYGGYVDPNNYLNKGENMATLTDRDDIENLYLRELGRTSYGDPGADGRVGQDWKQQYYEITGSQEWKDRQKQFGSGGSASGTVLAPGNYTVK